MSKQELGTYIHMSGHFAWLCFSFSQFFQIAENKLYIFTLIIWRYDHIDGIEQSAMGNQLCKSKNINNMNITQI